MKSIEFLPLSKIVESEMNPRKSYSFSETKELSESIKKQGVLQPITVRIIETDDVLDDNIGEIVAIPSKYEIICGSRRFRASQMAELETIPAIVREMTDEEAFDAMITENLQRKDVEPMEEARAFNELLSRGHSFEELAARFGKSVSYIRLREKLNGLIPELKDLLEKKKLQLSHAQELCKLSSDFQEDLFNKKYSDQSESYNKWNDRTVKDIKRYIENDFRDMKKAIFINSSCITCEHLCSNNSLFEEYGGDKCTKPICFDEKTFAHRLQTAIDKSIERFVITNHGGDGNSTLIEELQSHGVEVIEYDGNKMMWYGAAEEPIRDEDDTDEEWEEALAEYHDDLKEENEKLQNGFFKAWGIGWTAEHDTFRIIKYRDGVTVGENNQPVDNSSVDELKEKDKRNFEIKKEKTVADLRTLISDSNYNELSYPNTELEKVAMIAVMIRKSGYKFQREIESQFNSELSYLDNCRSLNDNQYSLLVRAFIKEEITSSSVNYSSDLQQVLLAISKEAYPDDATKIELKHEETYLKRKEKIDEQIKELS